MADLTNSNISQAMQNAQAQFELDEALFLNEYLPRFLPQWLIAAANKRSETLGTRLAVAIMLTMLAAKRIRVERNTEYGMKMGKGFRDGRSLQTVDAVRSKIMRGKELIAERRFPMGVLINN